MPSGPPSTPDGISTDPDLIGPWSNTTVQLSLDFHPDQTVFAHARNFQLQGRWSANKSQNSLDILITSPITTRLPGLYEILNNLTIKLQIPPIEAVLAGTAQKPTTFDQNAVYLTRDTGPPPPTGGPPPPTGGPPPPTGGPPPSGSGAPPSYTTSLPGHDDGTSGNPWGYPSTGIVVVPHEDEGGSSDNNTGLVVGLCIAAIAIGILSMIIMFLIRRWRDRSYKYQET